jgi:alpha/beta superfamily hydrolase
MTVAKHKKRGCRYWRNLGMFTALVSFIGVSFIGLLFLVYVGHPFYLSYGWSHPKRLAVCCVTPADRDMDYEDVSFTTSDGLTLRGWYIPSQNKAAVILIHPIASNRIGVLNVAEVLTSNGYGVLLFDLRAHGESDGQVLPFGGDEAEDVRGAAVYLQTRPDIDPNRIGAMGLSLGAQVSILGAARTKAIKAVVADGPCCTTFEDWPSPESLSDWLYVPYDVVFFPMLQWRTGVSNPVSVQEAIAKISPRPILLIGGGSERSMLEHHYNAAGGPKTLWIISQAGHINGLTVRPEEYEERIVRFFDQALLRKSQ